jgi:hypothetical protein
LTRLATVACFAVIALGGCSRGSDSEVRPAPSSAPSPATPAPQSAAPSAAASAPTVLVPDDAETDVEHRITEQNLESELDRLEREIEGG